MGNTVSRSIQEEVWQSQRFSLIADETRDIGYKEQHTYVLRWINLTDMAVNEDFIGLYERNKTDAQTVTSPLKDILLHFNLKLELEWHSVEHIPPPG